jgi:hypothetical protein
MISRQDQIFGAVLLRSIREGAADLIECAGDHPGLFILDGTRHVLIKEATSSGGNFRFTFSPAAIGRLLKCLGETGFFSTYLLLVANGKNVCELSSPEWQNLLEVDAPSSSQTVTVVSRPNHSFYVRGPKGEREKTVPKNRFPSFGKRGMS